MPKWSKTEPEIRVTLSVECCEQNWVIISDYMNYMKQIWHKARETENHHGGTSQIHLSWKSNTTAAAILNFEKCQYLPILTFFKIQYGDCRRVGFSWKVNLICSAMMLFCLSISSDWRNTFPPNSVDRCIISQSVSGTLDRPRVVAPSKTCGYVRSSRRRWRWTQCDVRATRRHWLRWMLLFTYLLCCAVSHVGPF